MPAKTVHDIPEDVVVEFRRHRNEISIETVTVEGNHYHLDDGERLLFGIRGEKIVDPITNALFLRITNSLAHEGFGPLAYDLMIELGSEEPLQGVITGTGLSEDSRAVWMYYLDRREDVSRVRLTDNHPWFLQGIIDRDFPFVWRKNCEILPKVLQLPNTVQVTGTEGIPTVEISSDEVDEQLESVFAAMDAESGRS